MYNIYLDYSVTFFTDVGSVMWGQGKGADMEFSILF